MRIGVYGIAGEKGPRLERGPCPNGAEGCRPKVNKFCAVATCAFRKGMCFCFECADFRCEVTKSGPVAFGYCTYIAGKA